MTTGSSGEQRRHTERVQAEFVEWLLMSKGERSDRGLPTSYQQFAVRKGVTAETLRRWRNDEAFQRRVASRKVDYESGGPALFCPPDAYDKPELSRHIGERQKESKRRSRVEERVAEAAASGSEDERDYALVKESVRDLAAQGDAKALELYMRYWGKAHAEREEEERHSKFPEMSDLQLQRAVLSMIDPTVVAEAAGGGQ